MDNPPTLQCQESIGIFQFFPYEFEEISLDSWKWSVIFLKSWTLTGCFSKATNSSINSKQFSPFIATLCSLRVVLKWLHNTYPRGWERKLSHTSITLIQHKTRSLYIGGWFISNDLDYTRKFRVLKANSIVKPTKLSKTWVAYYTMVFMLDEREVHSYAIISSLIRGMQVEGGEGWNVDFYWGLGGLLIFS